MDIKQIKQDLDIITEWLRKEFQTIRTGMASPAILDGVKADLYGAMTPLSQMASISIEGPKSLLVSPYDKSATKAIEKSIIDSDLGVSVVGTDTGIRISFPDLTADRREMLGKIAKQKLEDAKVSIRKERDDIRQGLQKQEKDKEISKDELHTQEQNLEEIIKKTISDLEVMLKAKQEEITL